MSFETILNSSGFVSLILVFSYALVSMHVLHFSGVKRGQFEGWRQFWRFDKEMQDAHAAGSPVGMLLVIVGILFAVP